MVDPPAAVAGGLGRDFFARPATEVAPDLCGKRLERLGDGLAARIVECEAYTEEDPACHAHRGRTVRNAPLFGAAGTLYVYLSYGVHWLLNIATGEEGEGQAVLLRAAQPLAGHPVMRARRGGRGDRELLRGPGRLAQAFGLDGTWSGVDLCGTPEPALRITDDGLRPPLTRTARVGVSVAADCPWRWAVEGSPWVSRLVRSPRAPCPDA